MGKHGPAPTPTALKIIRGNPGKRPLNKLEPKPDVSLPSCPKNLDKVAKREWKRITKELLKVGLLTQLDRAALALYCQSWSDWLRARENIDKFGMVIKTTNGNEVMSPHVFIAKGAMNECTRLAVQFGLTPSGRSSLKVEKSKDSSLEEIAAARAYAVRTSQG